MRQCETTTHKEERQNIIQFMKIIDKVYDLFVNKCLNIYWFIKNTSVHSCIELRRCRVCEKYAARSVQRKQNIRAVFIHQDIVMVSAIDDLKL